MSDNKESVLEQKVENLEHQLRIAMNHIQELYRKLHSVSITTKQSVVWAERMCIENQINFADAQYRSMSLNVVPSPTSI